MRDLPWPVDGDGAAVVVAEVEERGHRDGCLSEPEPSEAFVIHERENRCAKGDRAGGGLSDGA